MDQRVEFACLFFQIDPVKLTHLNPDRTLIEKLSQPGRSAIHIGLRAQLVTQIPVDACIQMERFRTLEPTRVNMSVCLHVRSNFKSIFITTFMHNIFSLYMKDTLAYEHSSVALNIWSKYLPIIMILIIMWANRKMDILPG